MKEDFGATLLKIAAALDGLAARVEAEETSAKAQEPAAVEKTASMRSARAGFGDAVSQPSTGRGSGAAEANFVASIMS